MLGAQASSLQVMAKGASAEKVGWKRAYPGGSPATWKTQVLAKRRPCWVRRLPACSHGERVVWPRTPQRATDDDRPRSMRLASSPGYDYWPLWDLYPNIGGACLGVVSVQVD